MTGGAVSSRICCCQSAAACCPLHEAACRVPEIGPRFKALTVTVESVALSRHPFASEVERAVYKAARVVLHGVLVCRRVLEVPCGMMIATGTARAEAVQIEVIK